MTQWAAVNTEVGEFVFTEASVVGFLLCQSLAVVWYCCSFGQTGDYHNLFCNLFWEIRDSKGGQT